jgi:hypothetical protein
MDDLPRAVRDLFDDANPAIVATSGGVDRPQLSVVWIERRGNDLAFGSDHRFLPRLDH